MEELKLYLLLPGGYLEVYVVFGVTKARGKDRYYTMHIYLCGMPLELEPRATGVAVPISPT